MSIIDIIRLQFASDKDFCRKLYAILGFMPRHTAIYHEALKHSSVKVLEQDFHGKDNERLEYLGDAILGSVVADILYRRYPTKHEGFLTNARSKMVRRDTLNKLSHRMGLDTLLHASVGGHSHNCCVAGNALEAFVGAIYLDRGYKRCYRFIEQRLYGADFDFDAFINEDTNYKSRLIEWSQKCGFSCDFVIDRQDMEQGSPVFFCSVNICGVKAGTGKGYSKKESHQQAAREALRHTRRRDPILQAIRAASEESLAEASTAEAPDAALNE